jgi:hypothetical protein
MNPSPFKWGDGAVIRDGGVMSPAGSVAYDPSAREDAGTSPFEWGGGER